MVFAVCREPAVYCAGGGLARWSGESPPPWFPRVLLRGGAGKMVRREPATMVSAVWREPAVVHCREPATKEEARATSSGVLAPSSH
jgi:hypothetical protein